MGSDGFHGAQRKRVRGWTMGLSWPLLARSLISLGLSFPTEKGKERVLEYLKSLLELRKARGHHAGVVCLALAEVY